MIGLGLSLTKQLGGGFSPRALFANGEQGAWFDPSDLSTLFQDAAGTTPVTAPGQPVGMIRDKSGDDLHASQPTASKRPTYNPVDTILGETSTAGRLEYDFVDDALIFTAPTGWYTVAYADLSVVRIYRHYMVNGDPLPVQQFLGFVAIDRVLLEAEKANVTLYLTGKRYGITEADYIFESISSPYIGRGGTATGVTWSFGGGTVKNTMFTDTVVTTPRERIAFDVLDDTALTMFLCYGNNLTGSIPDLSNNTALQYFHCYVNNLTGSIPDLSNNTELKELYCYNNNLSGSIPDLSANTALTRFHCYGNNLTGSIPDLSANTALQQFYCLSNNLSGVAPSFSVPASLTSFDARSNALSETAVDTILAAFVAAGATSGTLKLEAGNAKPSASGLSDKSTLEGRGWTVTVTP